VISAISPQDVPSLDTSEHIITRLEKEMMLGKGRWVADFRESFLNYKVDDVTFDLFISGNTRMKGFMLSRMFSYFLNPNYEVGFFALSADNENEPSPKRVRKWIFAVKSCMRKSEMKWAWLALVGGSPSDSVKRLIQEAKDPEVGIAYLDTSSRQIVSADNYLGRQLKKWIKI
jgi:hypothetical protein